MQFPQPTNNGERPLIISLKDVEMRFDNRMILSNINLSVYNGDFIAITGPNGGGKTTLLRIILKLLKPTKGEVEYFAPNGVAASQLNIGYLPQKNMIDSRFPLTVGEVIESGLFGNRSLPKKEINELVRETLKIVDLEQHATQSIGNLSGGQLQRTLLGRAIISKPSVLILDEPLSYIDKRFAERFYEILKQLSANTTVILVSHEMNIIADMATRQLYVDHTATDFSDNN